MFFIINKLKKQVTHKESGIEWALDFTETTLEAETIEQYQ